MAEPQRLNKTNEAQFTKPFPSWLYVGFRENTKGLVKIVLA